MGTVVYELLNVKGNLSVVGLRDPISTFKNVVSHFQVRPAREMRCYCIPFFRSQLWDAPSEFLRLRHVSQTLYRKCLSDIFEKVTNLPYDTSKCALRNRQRDAKILLAGLSTLVGLDVSFAADRLFEMKGDTSGGLCMQEQYSDYLVYVDESGDHGLESIDPDYPIFVLVFCIFKKQHYVDRVVRELMHLKMAFWGHAEIVLHEHDIRKPRKDAPFALLFNRERRERFMASLNELMDSIPVVLVASLIDKTRLKQQYAIPTNPYEISLSFGLERVFHHLADAGQPNKTTSIIVERRGKREDEQLELVFRRICDGANFFKKPLPFDLVMVDKRANSAGLQIADLSARPIGIQCLRPSQPNRAYNIIKKKFRSDSSGGVAGWGLKVFP